MEASNAIAAFSSLQDAVTSGAYAAPNLDFLRYSRLRGSVIVIEGLISTGKTTLGENIAKFLNDLGIPAHFYQEFVDERVLQQFYSNPKKYACSFQYFMLRSCIANLDLAEQRAKAEGIVAIVDRSVWGNAVFAALQKGYGNISEEEWAVYLCILKTRAPCTAHCVIYLDCHPETCFERMAVRGREAEKIVPLPYLCDLERHYTTTMLLHVQKKTANIVPLRWDSFGTVRQALDAVLESSAQPSENKPAITGDLMKAYTGDRMLRARCVQELIEKKSLHIE